jgi:hypothetical protein
MDLCDSRMDLNRSNQEPWKMIDGPKRFSDALARMIDGPEQIHRWTSEDEQGHRRMRWRLSAFFASLNCV